MKTNEVRLIDANALKTSFEEDGHLSTCIEEFIDNAPTIDVEPVRHGRWIQNKTLPAYHRCSICGVTHKMQVSCNKYVMLYYCPRCGAKMDALRNDDVPLPEPPKEGNDEQHHDGL